MIRQSMVQGRKQEASGGCHHEDGESNDVCASDVVMLAGKVQVSAALADQKKHGWNKVGIDVD